MPNLFEGFNVTCMAYGITGAGKTFTMLGNQSEKSNAKPAPGISVMAIDSIFELLKESTLEGYNNKVTMSYLEVYNENVKDLLSRNDHSLVVVEDPQKGVTVPGLFEAPVCSAKEALNIILSGNLRRTMASTTSNEFSSRSHAIIQVNLVRSPKEKNS